MFRMSVSRIPIRFVVEGVGKAEGELVRIRSPRTVDAIVRALPIEGLAALWQEEVYFDIPATIDEENSQKEVEIGDLGYWPAGSCFCIFYGRTPASSGDKPVAASPVNVFGKIIGNPLVFRKTESGEAIRVEKA